MAEQQQNPGITTNTFTKGMVKDYNETFIGDGIWTHARNAVNNSHDGQLGVIGNEPSNLQCVTLPYTFIGGIYMVDGKWTVFTTDDTNSEIGIFDEYACTYTKVINDPCLAFKRSNLITGTYRKRYDCERLVYWNDNGLNPDRFIDVDNPPLKYTEAIVDSCIVKTIIKPYQLDCEKIRIVPLVDQPCISLKKGSISGTLPNGSYQACIAYTVNKVKVTDYIGLSEVQGLFSHENTSSSLEILISNIDQTFDEFELVLYTNINSQNVAKRLGFYSTSVGTIHVDRWDIEYETVPISQVVFRSEPIEKSDSIFQVGDYLLKIGAYSKYKFNYQQQANKIITKWVAVEYAADYYHKGNNNAGYMRDEQYPFFIRWIYNTGERSESYHIPGRAPIASDLVNTLGGDAFETMGPDAIIRQTWQVENTASVESTVTVTLPDGGVVIAKGNMGYWESTEQYPSDKHEIWGDLCGKQIRHHKFPDETVSDILSTNRNNGTTITILGVEFENITPPLDQNGNVIVSIVGYEILRGSREGNKSILGKGLFNNMREYNIPGNTSKGLFQNYPYNDLRDDAYLTADEQNGKNGSPDAKNNKLSTPFKKNIFSFHSPEVTFSNPYLNASEIKIYQEHYGTTTGSFETPFKHPKFKIATDFSTIISKIGSLITAAKVTYDAVAVLSTTVGGGINTPPISIAGTADMPLTTTLTAPLINSFATGISPGLFVGNVAIAGKNTATTLYNLAVDAAFLIFTVPALDEQIMKIITALIPKVQYAAQYNSHGFYNQNIKSTLGNRRRKITNSAYVGSSIQTFVSNTGTAYHVNNINRSKNVVVELATDVDATINQDTSRFTMGDAGVDVGFAAPSSKISSHYGSLKLSSPSQYGQLEGIKQISVYSCVNPIQPVKDTKYSTSILFGGDTYINRFTEKNTMFFFNDWLMGQPDEMEYDYTLHINIPYPRFWVNNTQKHSFFRLANDYRVLDRRDSALFFIKKGYFYLFNSGVRDFFVESEINLAYRDWSDDTNKRHYDPYSFQDLTSMFRSDIIQSGNYYKYDYSLSVSKLAGSHITWGTVLDRDYDPAIAATCYSYKPDRVLYSLPQQTESKKDNWRIFLTNNYKDFQSKVTAIKSVNKTGALFMMKNQGPLMFLGVEQLTLDGTGAKITIGDGALFSGPQQLQSLTNADSSYEYGSNQNKFSTINTTHGVFWVSQNQGKIFQYQTGMDEISRNGLKFWMAKYLPSELLKVYPLYPLYDNPVKGVGVHTIYDNVNEIVYICKKDYKPLRSDLLYDDGGFYYLDGYNTITIPGTTIQTCQSGYVLQGNQCVKVESIDPIQSGTVVNTTRTPYSVYGTSGTKLYNTASSSGTYTLLSTSNSFWKGSTSLADTQSAQLLNGPVNRLAIWGVASSGVIVNNYTAGGTADVPPINTWIGFNVCINIVETKTYYVCVAADNQYRISLDGTLILSDVTSSTNAFNYLHIYPVVITAGSHILAVEGYNTGIKAGFGCEIFDLSGIPSGTTVVDYLNAQTNYDNLGPVTIFTTRNVTEFSSNLYTCPTGYGLSNPSCSAPVCTRTLTMAPTNVTTPSVTIVKGKKVYVPFTNTEVWENASWTISYDPKSKAWISYHDWIPTFLLPTRDHFMSVNDNTIWKHNVRCDSYCNFYGVDYPFEVEFLSSTGQSVNTMRSIEYMLEVYKYHHDCRDKFHVLNENFDQAMIYNSEQVSGLLLLQEKAKNNPVAMLSFPQVNASSITINFSKVEQKYRFNQFWDITADRGMYNASLNVPMFNTKANGYEYQINPAYVNYSKTAIEHKKFRHNINRVWLKKGVSGGLKMIFKISNQKIHNSPR